MSTKSSIFYKEGFHLYEELLSEDVCLEIDSDVASNDKYDDPKLSLSALKELHEAIGIFLNKRKK